VEVLTRPDRVTPGAIGPGALFRTRPLMDRDATKQAKRTLRRAIRQRILALDPVEKQRQESALIAACQRLPGFGPARTVLLYVSAFPEEINTAPLMEAVRSRGSVLVVPRVDRRENVLRLHPIDDPARDLAPGVLDIPEPLAVLPEIDPRAIDWALIPGLAFDPRGYRLGRGAGHYDRLIPRLRRDTPTWALALDPQWVEALPIEPHDAPLGGVLGVGRTVRRNPETLPFSPDS
jgi:5-formyltetrahydrofolate cyclo-ligase